MVGMSLGVLAFLNMALASVRARKDAKAVQTRKNYIMGHTVLIVLTIVCSGVGFAAIYLNKVRNCPLLPIFSSSICRTRSKSARNTSPRPTVKSDCWLWF